MKLEQWVLFIDMLGFAAYNIKVNDDELSKELLDFMKDNVDKFNSVSLDNEFNFGLESDLKFSDFYDVQTVFISDSLVVNYKPKEVINVVVPKDFSKGEKGEALQDIYRDFLSALSLSFLFDRISTLQLNCISKKGMFLRGGISNKYCQIEGNFAVGEGLSESHCIESKFAKMPVVCLSRKFLSNNRILEFLIEMNRVDESWSLLGDWQVDSENFKESELLFFDYLGYYMSILQKVPFFKLTQLLVLIIKQKQVLESRLLKVNSGIISDFKVIEKYIWLIEYHNNTISYFINHKDFKFKKNENIDKALKLQMKELLINQDNNCTVP